MLHNTNRPRPLSPLKGRECRVSHLVVLLLTSNILLSTSAFFIFLSRTEQAAQPVLQADVPTQQPVLLHPKVPTNEFQSRRMKAYVGRSIQNSTIHEKRVVENEVDPRDQEIIKFYQTHKSHQVAYDPFKLRIPNFVDETDRRIFLRDPLNNHTLLPPGRPHLRGSVEVITDGSMTDLYDCGWSSNLNQYRRKPFYPSRQRLKFVSPLLVPAGCIFQHFIDGTLPKLMQAYEYLNNSQVKLLVHRPCDRSVIQILQKLNIPKENIEYYRGGYYTAEYQINTCVTPPWHPVLYQRARQLLGVPDQVPVTSSTVILLSRALYTQNGGRRILNFKEVLSFLQARYGGTVTQVLGVSHDLDFTMETFGKARIIIGVHGGALYNSLFAPATTKVIEYMPVNEKGSVVPANLAQSVIWNLASLQGQSFWRVYETRRSPRGDMEINISKLKNLLDAID